MPIGTNDAAFRRPHAHALRRYAVDAELFAVPRCRRFRAHHAAMSTASSSASSCDAAKADRADATRCDAGEQSLQLLHRVFRHPLSAAEARHDRRARRRRLRRDGELGRHSLFRPVSAGRRDASSEAERQNVFSIVAHEIAHQWFGNLVTMTLVGRSLAQRRLRLVDGGEGDRARSSRLEPVDGAADRRHGDGHGARRARRHAPDRADGQHHRRSQPRLRHDHLREGPRRHPHAGGAMSAKKTSAPACATI